MQTLLPLNILVNIDCGAHMDAEEWGQILHGGVCRACLSVGVSAGFLLVCVLSAAVCHVCLKCALHHAVKV